MNYILLHFTLFCDILLKQSAVGSVFSPVFSENSTFCKVIRTFCGS